MSTEFPLTKRNRLQLAKAFRTVPRVDLSIECVVEGQMGKAYVDNPAHPAAFEIQTGPFHYFAGDALGAGGQEMLSDFKPSNLFMPSAKGWLEAAKRMHGKRLISFNRYSFSSESLSLERLDRMSHGASLASPVRQMDSTLVARTWGQEHFIDVSDFESPADFEERGIGYYVERDGQIVGAAYSSLVCSKAIEVSIFVAEEYRRQGIATMLAAHLLRWCLQNNMDAHWDAANLESCRLAKKLGYVPAGGYQAYYLTA